MIYSLDNATELTSIDANRYRREVDETWWNFNSAFGGWAAATAFSAIRSHADCRGELLSLNAIFPKAIKAGTIEVKTNLLARRAQSDFWRAEFFSEEAPDEVLVAFDIVMGRKRSPDEDSFEKILPDAPEPSSLSEMGEQDAGPAWLQHYEQRPFFGTPFTKNARPTSCVWVWHKDHRPIDTKALIALSDTPM
ncbi:MAG: acyl-CoA thioesterase domain-containing protein, partial [Pseudomonadota bacterium]